MTQRGPVTRKRIGAPWEPPEWTPAEVSAFRALELGEASPDQQKLFLNVLLFKLARIRELSFWDGVDGQRGTDFAEGRRFVGLQCAKLLSINSGAFTKDGVSKSEHRPRGNS